MGLRIWFTSVEDDTASAELGDGLVEELIFARAQTIRTVVFLLWCMWGFHVLKYLCTQQSVRKVV